MFQTKVVEKIKTHILCSVTFSLEYRAVCEIMRKNTLETHMPQMIIERMRIACWIPNIACPLQRLLHELASMLRYTYNACLVLLSFANWTKCGAA